jgi:hypothetical protein
LFPMIKSLGPRDTGVPSIVTPGAPAVRVVLAKATADGRRVRAWEPMVKIAVLLGTVREIGRKELLTRVPLSASEIGAPEMVIAGPPITAV